MHIISGSLKGRVFQTPHGHHTHPMGDRVKVALFNVLGELDGQKVLDAYAGSGALGFEAYSLGANEVVFIDDNLKAVRTLQENIKSLALTRHTKVIASTITAWAKTATDEFDIIFADPPYDAVRESEILSLITHVSIGGLFIISVPRDYPVIQDSSLEPLKQKYFAGAQLQFYRKH
jgi:16S rRNA (guanine(966)-N(2))-methyltransferase RsmD